ncbi:MAG: hypothetical protein WC872_00195 [Candidatus Absconditabacterales bacterium]|jgi:hypothetical protein
MPNIKIYGVVKSPATEEQLKDFESLSTKIKEIFKNESYAEDIVVTKVVSEVIDLNNKEQPYIQLELNCMRDLKKKLEKLKALGMDIQVLKLYDFVPKNQ